MVGRVPMFIAVFGYVQLVLLPEALALSEGTGADPAAVEWARVGRVLVPLAGRLELCGGGRDGWGDVAQWNVGVVHRAEVFRGVPRARDRITACSLEFADEAV
jgi:hypothetical protein